MKVIDLLNNIENDEIKDGTAFEVIGDFFYKLIVIDKNLYCINERTKQLEMLNSKYIGRFDNRQYEIIELENKIEEKKIPEKIKEIENGDFLEIPSTHEIMDKINEIIDYLECLENKGE